MTRVVEQSNRRNENGIYLTKLLGEIPGIKPAKLYDHATRSAYHLYMFRYDKAQFAGLDHAGFVVPTRADLVAWQEHLEANGVVRADTADKPLTQSPIADEPYGSILVFRDPDNVQLEFLAPAGH